MGRQMNRNDEDVVRKNVDFPRPALHRVVALGGNVLVEKGVKRINLENT